MVKKLICISYLFFITVSAQKMEIKYQDRQGHVVSYLDLYTDYSVFASLYANVEYSDVKQEDDFYVKNYKENTIYRKDVEMKKNFFSKQPLGLFAWKIGTETKEILGYKCTEATMEYRKHKYIAYFTQEIPIPDGPHIFNGLPGLILEIAREDYGHSFGLYAVSIETNAPASFDFDLKKFMSNKFISYDEFVNEINEKTVNWYKHLMSSKYENSAWGIVDNYRIDNLYMKSNAEIIRIADEHNGFSFEKQMNKSSTVNNSQE